MRIAITAAGPTLDAEVDPRFGRCPYFIIVDPETMEFEAVDNSSAMAAGGAGISAAQAIAGKGVQAVLTGNCGPNAYGVLSSADIQVTGYNLIPQHAITRLAEVTAEERRKIIEDMIGIGVYDLKKEEAQKQLDVAETNLRVASARIEEVRLRVESLERERNDYIKSTSLKKEINRLEAKLVSRELKEIKDDMDELQADAKSHRTRLTRSREDERSLARRETL